MGRPILEDIAARGRLPVVTGGSGFYLRALLDGLAQPGPRQDETLRARLLAREAKTPGSISTDCCSGISIRRTAARIHPNDTPKVMRALEICISASKTATEVFAAGRDALQGFRVLKIGLFPNRELLYKRLDARMEAMFSAGLIEETSTDSGAWVWPGIASHSNRSAISRRCERIQGELSPKDALFYATRETRRYAKRQMTWFRQDKGMEIFPGFGDDPVVIEKVCERVGRFLTEA